MWFIGESISSISIFSLGIKELINSYFVALGQELFIIYIVSGFKCHGSCIYIMSIYLKDKVS